MYLNEQMQKSESKDIDITTKLISINYIKTISLPSLLPKVSHN